MTSWRSQERKSALLVGIVLLAMAGWSAYRGSDSAMAIFGALGGALLVVGLFVPPAARTFHVVWMRLAHALGWVNSRILLALMFYGILTPIGLFQRLIGRDALRRRGSPGGSYWIPRKLPRQPKEQFERLF